MKTAYNFATDLLQLLHPQCISLVESKLMFLLWIPFLESPTFHVRSISVLSMYQCLKRWIINYLYLNNACDDEQSQLCHNCTQKRVDGTNCGDDPSRTVVLQVSIVMFLGPDNKLQQINRCITCVICEMSHLKRTSMGHVVSFVEHLILLWHTS